MIHSYFLALLPLLLACVIPALLFAKRRLRKRGPLLLSPLTEAACRVSIVITLYNEEQAVINLIAELTRLVSIWPPDNKMELIFVDDGSKDDTVASLGRIIPSQWNYRLVRHEYNQGFGAALRTGIKEAGGDIIVCYDADCSYLPEDILRLVSAVQKGADVCSGYPSNYIQAATATTFRRILTLGNTLAYNLCLGAPKNALPVMSNAFRAYRAELIKSVDYKSHGFGAASEILGILYLMGARISFIDTPWRDRQFGYSKMRVIRAIKEHVGVLLRLALI